MNIPSAHSYRISSLSKQGFGEKQKPSQPSDKPEKYESAEEPTEQRELQQLKARNREVRAHEAAHMAAGGGLVRGGANFSYERGPDGVMYAVGGEVSIDASTGQSPEENLRKAEAIRRAALAPAGPSSQDRSVAAMAARMAAAARMEIARANQEEMDEAPNTKPEGAAGADRYQQFEGLRNSASSELNEYA